jgi:DNA-binding transcriptional MerR regulator
MSTSLVLPEFKATEIALSLFNPQEAESTVAECVENAKAVTSVLTIQDLNDAGASIKDIRRIKTELETHRVQLKSPFKTHGEKIDDYFKSLNKELLEQDKRLSEGMNTFNKKQKELAQAKADEERKRMEAELEKEKKEAEAKGEPPPTAIIPEVVSVKVEKLSTMNSAGIGTRRQKTWEVVDISLVPVEYLQIDTVKMNKKRMELGFEDSSPVQGIKYGYSEKV